MPSSVALHAAAALGAVGVAELASLVGNRAFGSLLARNPGATQLLRQSHPHPAGPPAPPRPDPPGAPDPGPGALRSRLTFSSAGFLMQSGPPHGVYIPQGTQRTDWQEWVKGFLDFHAFALNLGSGDPHPQTSATIEGGSGSLAEIADIVTREAELDRTTHWLEAHQLFGADDALLMVSHYYRVVRDPREAAVSIQGGVTGPTAHFPLGGPRGASPSFDRPGLQGAVAVISPLVATNRSGCTLTWIFPQASFFSDWPAPGGPMRLQSLLAGAQLSYSVLLSSSLAFQSFLQALAGFTWPTQGATGSGATQLGGGLALVYSIPLGDTVNGVPSWLGTVQVAPQITLTETHTFLPDAVGMPATIRDTLDLGATIVIAWQPRGWGWLFGEPPPPAHRTAAMRP
jgi:hypothetical protein